MYPLTLTRNLTASPCKPQELRRGRRSQLPSPFGPGPHLACDAPDSPVASTHQRIW